MTDHANRPSESAPPIPDEVAAKLEELRQQIDRLDEEIVQLLNVRAGHALDIGRLKESVRLPTYQPGREIAILEHVRQVNGGPLDAGAVTRLFERIIDENRRLERLAERLDDGKRTESQDPPGSA